jgi:hypothetical protein
MEESIYGYVGDVSRPSQSHVGWEASGTMDLVETSLTSRKCSRGGELRSLDLELERKRRAAVCSSLTSRSWIKMPPEAPTCHRNWNWDRERGGIE